MAIAGAAITAAPSDVEELQAGEVATMLSEVKSSLRPPRISSSPPLSSPCSPCSLAALPTWGMALTRPNMRLMRSVTRRRRGLTTAVSMERKRPTLRRVTRRMRSGKITTCLMTRNQRRKSPANCDIQCKIFLQMTSIFVVTFIFIHVHKKFVSLEIKHENPAFLTGGMQIKKEKKKKK